MNTRYRDLLVLVLVLAGIASLPVMAQNVVCEAPSRAADAAPLAGHYYLSGVREVGSELLLKPDGSFQWMLVYGAADHSAQGRWWRNGDCVGMAGEQGRSRRSSCCAATAMRWRVPPMRIWTGIR